MALVKILEAVADDTQVKIIPVVQAGDIKEAVRITKLEVWVQAVDPVEFGAHTGAVLPEAVVEDGAAGTFLNHSERKFADPQTLVKATELATAAGLKTLIFASSL